VRTNPIVLVPVVLVSLAAGAGLLAPMKTAAQSAGQTEPAQQARASLAAVADYRAANGAGILADYRELLAIPNVASDSVGIWRNAEYLRGRLEGLGVDAELLTLPGAPPVVFGELRVPGAERTLALYVHYDGQPADPANWTHGPWEPTLYTASMEAGGEPRPWPEPGAADRGGRVDRGGRADRAAQADEAGQADRAGQSAGAQVADPIDPEWRIYARSASDDKVPLGALFPVLETFREHELTPTSNLVFFFEGEEEAGSPHLETYLERYRDRVADVDVWLFLDGPTHTSGRPQLTFGVRGVTGLSVTVYGAARSLHSGHYGNWAPVPGMMLARLLASMKTEDGRVLIDGFYETVAPLGRAERRALDALPDTDAELAAELGLARTEGAPAELAERLLLPALTVKGLASGNTGPLTRNVIPAEATAELGIRLVKGNDPEHMQELVEAHIRGQGYHIVRAEPDMETRLAHRRIAKVTRESGYPAARTDMSLPVVQDVIGAAQRAAPDVLLVPSLGGSLPLYLFTDGLGHPAVIVPIANHDNNQHAPDENLRVGNLWYGMDLYAALLSME
jgi:acetylornithine deacetylase/succinyl-diaminopimelate desuccinylase-like protein